MSQTVPDDLTVSVPESAFTIAGFHAWLESDEFPKVGRIDLCDAEVLVDMSPERAESHTLVKTEIYRVLSALVRERDLGEFLCDGVRYTSERAGINTEPDGLFFTFDALDAGRIHGGREHDNPLGFSGQVDWILEVVSPSSRDKDYRRLMRKYAEAGVREYWTVDALGETIAFDIHVLGPNGYRIATVVGGWCRSAVFGREFRIEREHHRGRPRYTLSIRATG